MARPATDYEFDSLGRQTASVGPVVYDELAGQYVRHRSETHYDDTTGRLQETWTNIRVVTDALGHVLSTSYADKQVTAFEYDLFGRKIKETRRGYSGGALTLSVAVETRYDAQGNVVAESNAYDALAQTAVWSESAQSFVDTAQGNAPLPTKLFEYDSQNRLAAVTLGTVIDPATGLPARPRYEYRYDSQGSLVRILDPYDHITEFTFDARGNQLTRTLPIGTGTPADPSDFVERKFYDSRGRLEHEISFEGVVTAYVYDDTPAGGGRLAQKEYWPDVTVYNNGAGAPTEITAYASDPLGRTLSTTQDRDGNLATTADQRIVSNGYDPSGQLVSVSSPEGTIHYEYDRVTGSRTRTYTGDLDETSAPTVGDGEEVTDTRYDYDALGRLVSVTVAERNDVPLATPEVTEYRYDLLGNLAQQRLPNEVVTSYTYDSLNRLTQLRSLHDDYAAGTDWLFDASQENLLVQFDYNLLADGRRSGVTETDDGDQTTRIDWLYDQLGRLTREVYDSWDNSLDFTGDYLLDLVGNRLAKKTDRQPTAQQLADYRIGAAMSLQNVDEVITSLFDANDRLLTEAKDVAGGTTEDRFTRYEYGPGATISPAFGGTGTQQTKRTVRQGLNDSGNKVGEDTYTYNLQGRMGPTLIDSDGDGSADTRIGYTYGDDGIRVSQTVTEDTDADVSFDDETPQETKYLVDHQNPTGYAQILEDKDAAGTIQKSYTLGLDVTSQTLYTGATHFLLYDGHGSTRGLVDATGQPLVGQVFRYDAFGNRLDSNSALTTLLYSGEQTDRTGLQYLRARYYDPSTGRFNCLDPFFGNLQDPLSLHKHLYADADGVNHADPAGLFTHGDVGTAMRIGANLMAKFVIPTALTVLSRAATGYLIVGAIGGIDSLFDDNVGFWEGFHDAGVFGAGFALAAPYLPVRVVVGVIGAFTGIGIVDSLLRDNPWQAVFRFGVGAASLGIVYWHVAARNAALANLSEQIRIKALGTSPELGGNFNPAEARVATALEIFLGRTLQRSSDPAFDWVDPKNGLTYDAVIVRQGQIEASMAEARGAVYKHIFLKDGLDVTVIDATELGSSELGALEAALQSLPRIGLGGRAQTKILVVRPGRQ